LQGKRVTTRGGAARQLAAGGGGNPLAPDIADHGIPMVEEIFQAAQGH
jgi:hypothetical protein